MPDLIEVNANMPQSLHFVWFGGPIPGAGAAHDYLENIRTVAINAASHQVFVWLSPQFSTNPHVYTQNRQWCEGTGNVTPRDVTDPGDLVLKPTEIAALQLQWDTPERNYGAMSDIARVAILAQHGGMYMDTDCSMTANPNPATIVLRYGFMTTKPRWDSVSFTNSIMASVAGGQFVTAFRDDIAAVYQTRVLEKDLADRVAAIRSRIRISDDPVRRRGDIHDKTVMLAGPGRLNVTASRFTLPGGVRLYAYGNSDGWKDANIQSCVIPYRSMPEMPEETNLAPFGNMHLEWHNSWLEAPPPVAPEAGGDDDGAGPADPLDAADEPALEAAV